MPPALLLLMLPAAGPATIQVSPDGRADAPGTPAAPTSLAGARELARRQIAAGLTGDLVVELRAGRYELAAPLQFGPGDGGTDRHAVIWRAAPGANVRLSGGVPVTDWQVQGDLWVAELPDLGEEWYPRWLTVNGAPAIRAREPDGSPEAPASYFALNGGSLDPERTRYTIAVPRETVGEWDNLADVELCWLGNWEICRKRLESIDVATGTVVLAPPHAGVHDAMQPTPGRPAYFENALEFCDAPGEWYLDRATATLYYCPREGETPAECEAVLARLPRLLELRGERDRPVRNLHFVGLTFEDADWTLPPFGFNGVQASFHTVPREGQRGWDWGAWGCTEPALEWTYAHGCSLRDGVLRNLAPVGIRLRQGCRDNEIAGNLVQDLGASGIMLGEDYAMLDGSTATVPAADVPTNNRIANNLVRRCGRVDYGSVGIQAGFCDGTRIEHNRVDDLPYTGISVGWRWDDAPTVCRNNHIVANHVSDVMKILCDGGCLYTLGWQPDSTITDNLFHDARRSAVAHGAPNNGIFFDQGSKGFHVARNLIYATSAEPVRFNQCTREQQTWDGNQFGTTQATAGIRGLALLGDGTGSAIEVPHAPELDPAELTLEAWVKLDRLPDDGDARRWVVNKNDDEWVASHFALVCQGTRVGAYVNNQGGQAGTREAWSEEGVVTLNVWHHLAMTYDGRDLVVHADGREVARTAVNEPRTIGALPLAIGRRQDAYNWFLGAIDEVRLYARALTPAQLRARGEARGRPVDDGVQPVGWWSFDDLAEVDAVLERYRANAGLEPGYRERLR